MAIRFWMVFFVAVVSCSKLYAGDMTINPYPIEAFKIPQAPVSVEPVVALPVSDVPGYWPVRKGQDLAAVLADWSEREGVGFVWDVPEYDFIVMRSLELSGAYEEAVMVLLEQYRAYDLRPVGQLYLPSETDEKVLLVSLDHSNL